VGRQTRTRSAEHHNAQPELFGGATAEQWELPPPARSSVELQHEDSRRVAELGEAKTAAGGQIEAALRPRLLV
jgi:hypothetical protein